MKNKFALLSICMVILSIFSFGMVSAQEEIVIDFYFPQAVDGPIADAMNGYAEQFMAENPGIIVNPIYTGSYNQTRDTILAEGDDLIVDVAVMLAIDLFSFIEEGTLLFPHNNSLTKWKMVKDMLQVFISAFLENSVGPDGQVWSIPFQRSTPIMYYNARFIRS